MGNQAVGRRAVLRGGVALAGALALGGRVRAEGSPPEERPTLVVLWLNGGPAGLFNSAGSFLASGAFGVTGGNIRSLGNGLFVDAASLGALPAMACDHMASINFRHGIVRPHEKARAAVLEAGPRSQLVRLASVMPDAPVRCVVLNDLGLPAGVSSEPPAEAGVRLSRVIDVSEMAGRLGLREAMQVSGAYGMPGAAAGVHDLRSTFAAIEILVRGGAGVIFAQPAYTGRPDRQFDTHGDDSGAQAREVMAPITPFLATFLERVLTLPQQNVVTVLMGEFSRTIPESDHEPGGTATVVGKYVKTGTAGPQRADGSPPETAAPPEGVWAFASAALRLKEAPFGSNPNPELIL